MLVNFELVVFGIVVVVVVCLRLVAKPKKNPPCPGNRSALVAPKKKGHPAPPLLYLVVYTLVREWWEAHAVSFDFALEIVYLIAQRNHFQRKGYLYLGCEARALLVVILRCVVRSYEKTRVESYGAQVETPRAQEVNRRALLSR